MSADQTDRPRSTAMRAAAGKQQARSRRRRTLLILGAAVAAVALIVAGVYLLRPEPEPSGGQQAAEEQMTVHGTDKYPYLVGAPGPGEQAPGFTLQATTGGEIALSDYRGQSVLLYLHGGAMCQPCFDQIASLEKQADNLEEAGVDQVLSITNDPLEVSAQKSRDMGLSTPTLADPGLAASKRYDAQSYGMMNGKANGHTFILVSPEGRIRWRADYGGEPKYVMYLPVDRLLADMRAGLTAGGDA